MSALSFFNNGSSDKHGNIDYQNEHGYLLQPLLMTAS